MTSVVPPVFMLQVLLREVSGRKGERGGGEKKEHTRLVPMFFMTKYLPAATVVLLIKSHLLKMSVVV